MYQLPEDYPSVVETFQTKLGSAVCVKLTLARLPMATIYCHLATYFSFPGAILGHKTSGWLGCAVHSMRDITREPMWPSEKLENE